MAGLPWLRRPVRSPRPLQISIFPLSFPTDVPPDETPSALWSAKKPRSWQNRLDPWAPVFAGYIVQEFLRWPGYLSPSSSVKFSELPNGILALKGTPPLGLAQIFLFIGAMEICTWRFYEGPYPGTVPAGKAPGDVAGELWVRYEDPAEKATKLNIELNNGRAAMMGITGMLMHDHLTGSWIPPGMGVY